MGGRETVEALVATINAKDVPGMDDLFHEDAVMEWPQSGERIVGGDNRRGVYHGWRAAWVEQMDTPAASH